MILDETFSLIKSKIEFKKIKNVYLSNHFNIIQLENGAIGASMNYYRFKSELEKQKRYNLLIKKIKEDPSLESYLFKESASNLLKLNLKVCLLSALSTDLIFNCNEFNITTTPPPTIFLNINYATIIGLGGYVDTIIRYTKIKNIHISDLDYKNNKKRMDKVISNYKGRFPNKNISISDGKDNKRRIESSDLVSITSSAFCNGTMEKLLGYSKHCKKIIIQGASATIYPKILFEKGVSLISMTLKPLNLLQIAIKNPEMFKFLLENGLPVIHISQKLETDK